MNSQQLQLKIAQIRQCIADIQNASSGIGAQASGEPGAAAQGGRGRNIPTQLDETIGELRAACSMVGRRQAISSLRFEVWKAAAKDRASEDKLIKKQIALAGPALNLGRCAFYTLTKETGEAVCTVQWTRGEPSLALPAILPHEIVKELVGEKFVALYNDLAPERKQADIAQFLVNYKMRSFLALPYDDPATPRGFFTFWDCDAPVRWMPAEIDLLIEISHIICLKSAQLTAERQLSEAKNRLESQIRERTSELAVANRKLVEDLAEREKAQGALTSENELISVTLRSLNQAVIALDAQARIVLFNACAENLTGWTAADAIAKPVKSVIELFEEKNHSQRCPDFIERCLASFENNRENRYMLRSRTGREHIVAGQCVALQGHEHEKGAVLVLRDITRSWVMEEELLKIKKLESIGMLAAGIAQEFTTLLSSLSTYLFMARMSSMANDETGSLIGEAEKTTFKASMLTKQLLSFAKGCPSVKETASIKELVQDTVGFCLSGTPVDYRLDVPDDLLAVDIDKGQIDQALSNLLYNAIQSMPDGGLITVSGENVMIDPIAGQEVPLPFPLAAGKYVRVSVRDEGSGIPFDLMPHIFDPYFTTKKTGPGLGLTVAYSIIRGHDGHIAAESTPGRGSVFSFYLPASVKGSRKKPDDVSFLAKGSGKVLIFDDDVVAHTVIETLLAKAGYLPVSVTSGAQAVKSYAESLLQGQPFTVVIVDLTAHRDAREAVEQLRTIDRNARLIAFVGPDSDGVLPAKAGCIDCTVTKPFSVDEFLRTFNAVLSRDEEGERAGLKVVDERTI